MDKLKAFLNRHEWLKFTLFGLIFFNGCMGLAALAVGLISGPGVDMEFFILMYMMLLFLIPFGLFVAVIWLFVTLCEFVLKKLGIIRKGEFNV